MRVQVTGIVIGDSGNYGHIYYTDDSSETQDFKLSDDRAKEYFDFLKKMIKLDMLKQLEKWGELNPEDSIN